MPTEYCSGAVVFTRENGGIQYLIIRSLKGIYCFPKGHMEPGETEEETALREIREEVNLHVRLLDGFRMETAYPLVLENKPHVTKYITFFLAEYEGQTPHALEGEVMSQQLMTYEEAMASFQMENHKQVLREAHAYLTRL